MKILYFSLSLTFLTVAANGQDMATRIKTMYDDAVKRSNWTKAAYTPDLTGNWLQSGTVLMSINQGRVSWNLSKANKSQLDPPGDSQFKIVEIYRRDEYHMLIVKRPERYMTEPIEQCYYAIFIRNLSDLQGSFALSRRFCTKQKGQTEYWHGLSAHLEYRDEDINEFFFYTYNQ